MIVGAGVGDELPIQPDNNTKERINNGARYIDNFLLKNRAIIATSFQVYLFNFFSIYPNKLYGYYPIVG